MCPLIGKLLNNSKPQLCLPKQSVSILISGSGHSKISTGQTSPNVPMHSLDQQTARHVMVRAFRIRGTGLFNADGQ